MVGALKTAGVWAKLDVLWVLAAADSQAARQNWKQNLYNATPVSGPAFTADQGYAGDGAASYLASGFIPSSAGGQYALDSAHASYWSRTNAQSAGVAGGARTTSTTNQLLLPTRSWSDVTARRINQDSAGTNVALTSSLGHHLIRRATSTASALFANGSLYSAPTTASSALPTVEVALGGINTGGTVSAFCSYQVSAFTLGAGLSDAEVSSLYSTLQTYLQAVGAA